MISTILLLIVSFLLGTFIGVYLHKRLTEKLIREQSEKMILEKEEDYLDAFSKIKSGNSTFKSRVNDTVYVSVNLDKHGECDIIYLIDKQDIVIFQGNKCLHTSDGVNQSIVTDLIILIFSKYSRKINDVVDILGFVFNREDFEKSFNLKYDDLKKSPLFTRGVDVNEIDKINNENKNRFDIDEILDKISNLGIHSLTLEERLFLDNYSNEKRN